jgi:multiple sugar transport system ATP-binding protein
MTLGHRVAVLRAGVLQQCDAPQVLYDTPANVFVAGFIGSPAMNLFEAALAPDLGSVKIGSQELKLPSSLTRGMPGLQQYGGKHVILGIRPEDLEATSGELAGPTLQGDVELVEALGAEQLVHFRTDANIVRAEEPDPSQVDGAPALLGDVNIARIAPRHHVAAGERITFAVEPDRLEFFDPTSGDAIRD